MPMPPLEEALRDPVASWFEDRGFHVRHEVYFNGRVADLVSTRAEEVVAVELKLRDWTTALTQARAYQLGASRCYVALPHGRVARLERKLQRFRDAGVGLLSVTWPDAEVREVVEPEPSDRTLPFLEAGLREGRLARERARRRGPRWTRSR